MQKNNTFLGIDIGGTAAKIGIVNSDGEILEMDSFSVSFDGYQTPIIETVVKNTDAFLKRLGISEKTFSGIGVSATGQINVLEGTVAGSAGHIANWLGTPVKTILEEHYHLPVTVANDANCAVMGEQWKGAARDSHNVIMITVGTGVGGGIIVQDQLFSGSVGIAGELGHFTVQKDGIPCTCGNSDYRRRSQPEGRTVYPSAERKNPGEDHALFSGKSSYLCCRAWKQRRASGRSGILDAV